VYTFDNISLNALQHENCFRQNLYSKSKHIFMSSNFFPEIRAAYEVMLKIMVEPDRPQMAI
jgi:hypothetical protein